MKIKTSEPNVIWKAKTFLGEGVFWVPSHKKVYFVDIKKKKIFIFNTLNNRKSIIKVDKEIGFLAHIKNNIFILGLKRELRIVNLRSKKIIKSIDIEKKILNNRLNDGKVDLVGRLWFGTMDSLERNIKNGSLYCLDKNFNLNKVDSNYIITNGPAFLSKNIFYHTDSRLKMVYKIKIDNNYKIINKKIFIQFDKNNGSPDGMTLDNKKNLWVCHYGGSCISVYNKEGKKIHHIDFPTKNITNCVFGGKDNSELFVTSAIKSKNKLDKQQLKYSGCLFSVKTNLNGFVPKKFDYKA